MYFVTNSPIRSRFDLQQSAKHRGYSIPEDRILSASYVVAKYLHDQKFEKIVYLMGSLGISKEFDEFGIRYINADSDGISAAKLHSIISNGIELNPDVGAVVLSFDMNFTFSKLVEASNYLKDPNCLFIATSYDETYPTRNGVLIPAMGPLISAVEMGSCRKATIIGKPNPLMCKSLIDAGQIDPKRTLMIGDSAKYDILFASRCGFQSLFVDSGLNSLNDIRTWQMSNNVEDQSLVPDVYLPKLGDLLPLLP